MSSKATMDHEYEKLTANDVREEDRAAVRIEDMEKTILEMSLENERRKVKNLEKTVEIKRRDAEEDRRMLKHQLELSQSMNEEFQKITQDQKREVARLRQNIGRLKGAAGRSDATPPLPGAPELDRAHLIQQRYELPSTLTTETSSTERRRQLTTPSSNTSSRRSTSGRMPRGAQDSSAASGGTQGSSVALLDAQGAPVSLDDAQSSPAGHLASQDSPAPPGSAESSSAGPLDAPSSPALPGSAQSSSSGLLDAPISTALPGGAEGSPPGLAIDTGSPALSGSRMDSDGSPMEPRQLRSSSKRSSRASSTDGRTRTSSSGPSGSSSAGPFGSSSAGSRTHSQSPSTSSSSTPSSATSSQARKRRKTYTQEQKEIVLDTFVANGRKAAIGAAQAFEMGAPSVDTLLRRYRQRGREDAVRDLREDGEGKATNVKCTKWKLGILATILNYDATPTLEELMSLLNVESGRDIVLACGENDCPHCMNALTEREQRQGSELDMNACLERACESARKKYKKHEVRSRNTIAKWFTEQCQQPTTPRSSSEERRSFSSTGSSGSSSARSQTRSSFAEPSTSSSASSGAASPQRRRKRRRTYTRAEKDVVLEAYENEDRQAGIKAARRIGMNTSTANSLFRRYRKRGRRGAIHDQRVDVRRKGLNTKRTQWKLDTLSKTFHHKSPSSFRELTRLLNIETGRAIILACSEAGCPDCKHTLTENKKRECSELDIDHACKSSRKEYKRHMVSSSQTISKWVHEVPLLRIQCLDLE